MLASEVELCGSLGLGAGKPFLSHVGLWPQAAQLWLGLWLGVAENWLEASGPSGGRGERPCRSPVLRRYDTIQIDSPKLVGSVGRDKPTLSFDFPVVSGALAAVAAVAAE